MKKKIIYLLFSLLILNNCGFSPIYSNTNKADFAIEVVEIAGDGVVNNLINSEINRISDTNSLNRYKIKITTNYNKIILSKDTKGIVSDYQIVVSATFLLMKNKM